MGSPGIQEPWGSMAVVPEQEATEVREVQQLVLQVTEAQEEHAELVVPATERPAETVLLEMLEDLVEMVTTRAAAARGNQARTM